MRSFIIIQQMEGKRHNFKSVTINTKIWMKYRLTCKLDFCLPADNGAKRVGGDALIHACMVDHMRVIDQQVSLDEAEVRIRLSVYLSAVHLPPVDADKSISSLGRETEKIPQEHQVKNVSSSWVRNDFHTANTVTQLVSRHSSVLHCTTHVHRLHSGFTTDSRYNYL